MEFLIFLFGFLVGTLICLAFTIKSIRKYKNTSELYCNLYAEAADTIKDLVVLDKNMDDLR